MSKAVRWQVPFASVSGTQYRVDIYDEGFSGTPVTLLAGDEPFTTDEDADDDFFAPVRSQTGKLQVCTAIPAGGTLKLEDILPSDNISRPVRLVSIGANNSETIEWQGFLSCEAYNEDYIGIPQILDLSLISVLEAMDSVEVALNEDMAFKTILGHVCYALRAIQTKSGMTLFDQMYISAYCKNAMASTYFYNNVYFSAEEQISGDNITVEVHSISGKDILKQVAQFFGCCWREVGQNIWLEAIGKTNAFSFQSFSNIASQYVDDGSTITWLNAQAASANISGLTWRGTDHQRSVAQGMRRVKVTSKLDDFECKMSLEECPVNNLVENPDARQTTWGEVHVNTNETFYSQATHKHRLSSVKVELDSSYWSGKKATIQKGYNVSAINYQNTWHWADDDYRTNYEGLFHAITGTVQVGTVNHYCTSFMAWMRCKESDDVDAELLSGLLVCGLPAQYRVGTGQYLGIVWYPIAENDYLFKQTTPLIFAASKGKFNFDMEFKAFVSQLKKYDVYKMKRSGQRRGIEMAVKWGNKWLQYNSSTTSFSWGDSFATFPARDGQNYNDDGYDGKVHFEFPIDGFNCGLVSVYLYSKIYGDYENDGLQDTHNLFITKLDLEYEAPEEELRTDRSENVYADETGHAFKDELSVDVDLATYANNTKLATMLWSDSTTPVKLLTLGGNSIRPEVDLLARLKSYYSAARQKLELVVGHISTALPILTLNGISDGKTYTPVAEARDWRMEVSTLTCMENPS